MRALFVPFLCHILIAAGAVMACAHDRPHAPPTARGVIIEGSSHICVGEGLAARRGDRTNGGSAIIDTGCLNR
jgi:uncharacterized Zn-binding protein involved in type VI secretion